MSSRTSPSALLALSCGIVALPACDRATTGPQRTAVDRTVIVGGAGQARFPGTPLASPVVAKGVDSEGNEAGQEGLPVSWKVISGGGSIDPASPTTSVTGLASARWTLGPAAGTQTLEVSIDGSTPALVNAHAVAPGEIVYRSTTGSGAGLFVMAADGSERIPLTSVSVDATGPRWSPDGTAVAYSGTIEDGTDPQILLVELGALIETRLTDLAAPDSRGISVLDPAWSPDGRRIAFVVKQGEPGCARAAMNIWVMDRDGGNRRRLTTGCGLGHRKPDWSPDGNLIAFHQNRVAGGQTSEIMVVGADGTATRSLTPNGGDDLRPRWSPAGNRILFTRDRQVWLMNADGSGQELLWDPLSQGAVATDGWSPQGSQVLVTVYDDLNGNGGRIFRYDPATGTATRITPEEGNYSESDWRR